MLDIVCLANMHLIQYASSQRLVIKPWIQLSFILLFAKVMPWLYKSVGACGSFLNILIIGIYIAIFDNDIIYLTVYIVSQL